MIIMKFGFGVKDLETKLGNIAKVVKRVLAVTACFLILGGNTAEAAITVNVDQHGIKVECDDKKDNYKMVIKKENDGLVASKTWDTYRTEMTWEEVLNGSKYIKRGDEVILEIEANGGEKLETIRFRIGDTYRFGTSDGGNASSIAWNKSNSTSTGTGVEQKRTQSQQHQIQTESSQAQKSSSTIKKNKVQQNTWRKENYWTYHRPDGTIITGWAQDHGQWYYLDPQYNGQMCYNGWKRINGHWYYFWGSGAMASNCWIWIRLSNNGETRWYFVNSKGEMVTDAYVGNYHVNADGVWDYTR